jgi:hypothetical protein
MTPLSDSLRYDFAVLNLLWTSGNLDCHCEDPERSRRGRKNLLAIKIARPFVSHLEKRLMVAQDATNQRKNLLNSTITQ